MVGNANVELTNEQLNRLFEIGISLSAEQDMDVLLETILSAAREFTNAEGGTLYLMNEAKNQLIFSIVQNDKLGIKMGGTSDKKEIPFPPLYLYDENGEPNKKNIASYTALTEEVVNIQDAYDISKFDFTGTMKFDAASHYRSKSFLTVPLKTRSGEVVAVMQLINSRNDEGATVPFSPSVQKLVEALASNAAIAIDNQRLIKNQKHVFEAFLEVFARAIDEKSPYAGMHCQRVPEIAKMIAFAAVADDTVFKDFELSEDDWYAFHLASWLHDCGKVTTPEYIMDKATKLECITNRIHEVRARFEILRRDAHIEYLKKRLQGKIPAEQLVKEFNKKVAELTSDFQFIADVNVGYTPLSEEDLARIQKIAHRTYHRYFDKLAGLSWDEVERMNENMPPAENDKEPLLEDRIDHVFGGYNRGEIHNLSIVQGTLTSEEAKKVREHVETTIQMLKTIPFPYNIRNVVEYASGHHEHMDGTGYPNHLTGDKMSIPARILAIADCFEALSSSDRPYKKIKTLTQILAIMSEKAKSGHLDPDLFNLFLKERVFDEYAKEYMKPKQIDDVDITTYLVRARS